MGIDDVEAHPCTRFIICGANNCNKKLAELGTQGDVSLVQVAEVTRPVGVDSDREPLPIASPMTDAPSKENLIDSSPPISRVVGAGGVVDGTTAMIAEGVTTASWEVDGVSMTTEKLTSEQTEEVRDGKLGSRRTRTYGTSVVASCTLSLLSGSSDGGFVTLTELGWIMKESTSNSSVELPNLPINLLTPE